MLAGLFVVADVVAAKTASTILFGLALLAAGTFELVHAFWAPHWGGLFLRLLLGLFYAISGAMLGGYVLGLAEVLFVGLLPPEYSGYRNVFVFATLIVILLVMPNGLLGRSTEERA